MDTNAAWPFSRLDVVSLIPVRLTEPLRQSSGATADVVTEIAKCVRLDGARDIRQMTVQSGAWLDIDGAGGSSAPNWCTGPASFEIRRAVEDDRFSPFHDSASLRERERHASPMVRSRLYASTHRWHRAALAGDRFPVWATDNGLPDMLADPGVLAFELLRLERSSGRSDAVLMVHAQPDVSQPDPLRALRLLTLRSEPSRRWVEHILRGVGQLVADSRAPYHLCLAQPQRPLPPRAAATKGWSADEQWLWLLSTLQDERSYPVSEQNRRQLRQALHPLSADWTCAVMRAGTAFMGRPLTDDWEWSQDIQRFELAFLAETAPLLVRSLYADAIAFGLMKSTLLDDFAHELAALEDPISRPQELIALESDFTRFRNTLWWQDTGLSGHATLLLRKFDACHNHRESFDRLVTDFGDYSQKIERTELQRANEISQGSTALIGLVTCFGVPLGMLQVFGTNSTAVWILVAIYLAMLGIVPAGDHIIGLNLPLSWRTAKTPSRLTRIIWATFWIALIAALLLAGIVPTG